MSLPLGQEDTSSLPLGQHSPCHVDVVSQQLEARALLLLGWWARDEEADEDPDQTVTAQRHSHATSVAQVRREEANGSVTRKAPSSVAACRRRYVGRTGLTLDIDGSIVPVCETTRWMRSFFPVACRVAVA